MTALRFLSAYWLWRTKHLPGRHDQKRHGIWAAGHAKTLAQSLAETKTAKFERMAGEGGILNTAVVSLEDGTKVVAKGYVGFDSDWDYYEQIQQTEREVLASNLAPLFELRTPELERAPLTIEGEEADRHAVTAINRNMADEGAVVARYIDGFEPAGQSGLGWDDIKDQEGLWRMAAFDVVAGNIDRHEGNWGLDKAGKVWAIDHTAIFVTGSATQTSDKAMGGPAYRFAHTGERMPANVMKTLKGISDSDLKAAVAAGDIPAADQKWVVRDSIARRDALIEADSISYRMVSAPR